MRRRMISLLLAACLIAALCAAPASAASEEEAVRTVKALGIMVGDENGNMNLDQNVTRAQFAKLLTASSRFKDGVGEGTGYSLYSDVKSGHWASEYIRLAAEQGWMTGYTDGSFRPDGDITLEEACAATLRLLGYTSATLAGSYPYAQLNKASAVGLRDGIAREKGELMLRRDCAKMFYNALTAETAAGQIYAVTLGYSLTGDGEVNYTSVLLKNLNGPYIAGEDAAISFVPLTVYRDGKASDDAALDQYDVYYYNSDVRTLWIYTERASGKIDALAPSSSAPSSVTVAGKTYPIGSAEATYQLSALGGGSTDSYVTLLLGMDGAVAGVLTGSEVNAAYYGVLLSVSKSAAGEREAAVRSRVSVFCADGAQRSFTVERSVDYEPGRLVRVGVTDGSADITWLSEKRLSGRVNAAAGWIGDYALAENVNIIDVSPEGDAVAVEPERLAGLTLREGDVKFYSLDTAGRIDNLILDDATGDTWKYVYMDSVTDMTTDLSIYVIYHYYENGVPKTLHSSGRKYSADEGGAAVRYNADGTVKSMRQASSVRLTALGSRDAMADNRRYSLAEDVQVYLRRDDVYYLTEVSAVNAQDYTLTGWYDDFGRAAGGQIRLIIAAEK